ncbi:MAG: phage tail tape measure protein [Paracoccaceae bacterium]
MTTRETMTEVEEVTEQLEERFQSLIATTDLLGLSVEKTEARIETSAKSVERLSSTLSGEMRNAFEDLAFNGDSVSEVLHDLGDTLSRKAFSKAILPVTDHFGGMLAQGVGSLFQGLLPFADGAPFSQGRVMPFANGGIVNGPVRFPMRGGQGLMGEAGPEAIMPLARGADGKLGVRAAGGGGGGATVVMNISTPDVDGFRRAQGQIAAQMSRALSRGNRNR